MTVSPQTVLSTEQLRRYNGMSNAELLHIQSFLGRNGDVAGQQAISDCIDEIIAARASGVEYTPDGGLMHHPA